MIYKDFYKLIFVEILGLVVILIGFGIFSWSCKSKLYNEMDQILPYGKYSTIEEIKKGFYLNKYDLGGNSFSINFSYL